ncbi:hypothetical protein MVEN_01099500 [Mycena venus]|uniref:Uncharacterized protein n=1 Tax=Mycena venus TaxID=2733690 RepID=A0A8H6Y8I7_9AGAR|nr:hypothetical protein MVEN_01099500 [Mycena venus]
MSRQGNESTNIIANIYGGTGGVGGVGGVTGVANFTNNTSGGPQMHDTRFIEDLNKWLEFPPDTKDRQYHLQTLHHKATGRWLLHEYRFVKWKATPSSLWIKGICDWYWKECTKFNSD